MFHCAVPENIHTLPTEIPICPGNSSLASYFATKILAFKIHLPNPPREFPMTFLGVGMDFFLEVDVGSANILESCRGHNGICNVL